jgi:hypothetical protein
VEFAELDLHCTILALPNLVALEPCVVNSPFRALAPSSADILELGYSIKPIDLHDTLMVQSRKMNDPKYKNVWSIIKRLALFPSQPKKNSLEAFINNFLDFLYKYTIK